MELMTKLHEGELILLLRKKGNYTWKEVATVRSVTERTAQRWAEEKELDSTLKTDLAEFFGIDVRAFTNSDVREKVLKTYRSKHTVSRVEEEAVPLQIKKLSQKVDLVEELQKEILRLLKENQKRN